MINIMLGILSKECPSVNAIIDCKEVTYRDLSIIEVRFVYNRGYYAAKAYSTGTWIAKSPLGPDFKDDGTIKMDSLRDIAIIERYSSALELKRRPWPAVNNLIDVQRKLDGTILNIVKSNYRGLEDLFYKTYFTYTPIPTILISIAAGKQVKTLIGTVALDIQGNLHIISKVHPELDNIVNLMQGYGRILLPEGLNYE